MKAQCNYTLRCHRQLRRASKHIYSSRGKAKSISNSNAPSLFRRGKSLYRKLLLFAQRRGIRSVSSSTIIDIITMKTLFHTTTFLIHSTFINIIIISFKTFNWITMSAKLISFYKFISSKMYNRKSTVFEVFIIILYHHFRMVVL